MGYEELMKDCTELEGILRSINRVKKEEKGRIYTTITIQRGEERTKFCIPGIIFPDSIGHRVKYVKQARVGPSTCGTPMIYGYDHYLEDPGSEREYHFYNSNSL
ncbi:MAG: hypothetical protein Q7S55_05500 [Nanoarchaeota archaeon]|nr:hypothetical protein [Nanoarchaeota archaeon]